MGKKEKGRGGEHNQNNLNDRLEDRVYEIILLSL